MADSLAARRIMIDSQLRPQGVSDPQILAAFAAIAREDYVPTDRAAIAYRDRAVPLGEGRTMIAPAALGEMLMATGATAGQKALVIGPGSDYAAALLATMGLEVVALDSEKSPAPSASSVTVAAGPLEKGYAKAASYDLILVVGAIEHLPGALVDQLSDGGRIVTGLSERGVTRLARGVRTGERLALHPFADAQLPLLGGFAKSDVFAF